jgi:hypothetical protein
MAARARTVVAGLANAGASLVGVAIAVVFVAFIVGGSVYRTDCISDGGIHTRSWGLEGNFPYLWSPDDNRCEAHTLTRYLLGEVGLMGHVSQ